MVRRHLEEQQKPFNSKEESGHVKRLKRQKRKAEDEKMARTAAKFFKCSSNKQDIDAPCEILEGKITRCINNDIILVLIVIYVTLKSLIRKLNFGFR